MYIILIFLENNLCVHSHAFVSVALGTYIQYESAKRYMDSKYERRAHRKVPYNILTAVGTGTWKFDGPMTRERPGYLQMTNIPAPSQ